MFSTISVEISQPDPDTDLHLGILAGDINALQYWETKYRRLMIRRAIQRGLPNLDAENAFENAFHQTMTMATRLTPIGSSLRRMAYTVLARRIADYHRGSAPHASLEAEGESGREIAALMSPSTDESHELPEEIAGCLERLTKEQKQVIELLFIEDLPSDVVADRLGIARNSVIKAKGRALRALEECLERSDG